jgi:hypothetical protein
MKQFIKTRDAMSRVEKAILDLMPHIYTVPYAEKVANRKDWLAKTLRDAKMVLQVQYERAGNKGGKEARE